MKKLMNYLRGMVTVTATCPFPERLMNLCGLHRLDFWGVSWPEPCVVRFTTRRSCLRELHGLAQKINCEITVERSWGLPDFLLKFRRRYAFLVGLTLSLLAVGLLSRFVLTITVTGNETIPTPVILSELRLQGIHPGVYGPALDRKQLAQELVVRLKGLSWAGINLNGTRLEVGVREEKKAPNRVDEVGYYDIVSEADGLILAVRPEQGDAQVKVGDTVVRGDVLISGVVTMEPPMWSDLPERYYKTHARGQVFARTWRTLEGVLPLEALEKQYTGEEKSVYRLTILGKSFEILQNSSISPPFCDKISEVKKLPLSVTVRRTTYRAYKPQEIALNEDGARRLLENCLTRRLERLVGESGEISALRFSSRKEGNILHVTARGECREEIGREAPGTRAIPEER